jgi:hypothetical protein
MSLGHLKFAGMKTRVSKVPDSVTDIKKVQAKLETYSSTAQTTSFEYLGFCSTLYRLSECRNCADNNFNTVTKNILYLWPDEV